jgi:cobalt-zinc-cadmium efflux system outer membrane protein
MKRFSLIVLIVLALGSRPARAQEELTLEKAVGLALQKNPVLLTAQMDMSAAAGNRMQMEGIADPTLVLHEDGLAFRKKADGTSDHEIIFGLEQSLEFPGKRALRAEIGRAGEAQAALQLDRLRLVVAARVKKAYYAAVLARRTVESLEKSSSLLDEFIAGLLAKYETGDAAYADVLRTKVEKAKIRNRVLEERKNEAAALADLNLELGRRADEPATLVTDLAYIPMTRGLAAWKDEARAMSPTLKLLAAKKRQAGTALALARKNGLPDFSLGLYYPSKQMGDWGFFVGVSLPLWKTRRAGEIMEAEASADIATLSEGQEELRLMSRIGRAFESVKTAEAQVRIFEQNLLKDLEDEFRIGVSQYRIAKVEFLNVLDLYRTYVEARLERLKSLYLYLTSLADLEVAGEDATA